MLNSRRSIISALLFAALPFAMSDADAAAAPADETTAAPATDAVAATPEAVDATAATPEVAEDPNAVASSAASNPESATASSAESASPTVDTAAQESTAPVPPVPGATFEAVSHDSGAPTTGELTAAASVAAPTLAEVPVDDATAAPTDDNTGNVQVAPAAHAEAKERFAAVLAALHQFEEDSVEKLKEELSAIGVLLHLHSKASAQASTTGDYQAGDAS